MSRKKLPRETRICARPGCNTTREVIITSKLRYCSRECYWKTLYGKKRSKETIQKIVKSSKGRSSPMKGKKHPGKGTFYSGSKTIRCLECGKEHVVSAKSKRKFCNKSCAARFSNRKRRKASHETRFCKCECGGTFECRVTSSRQFINRDHYMKWVRDNNIDHFDRSKPPWNKDLTKETDPRVAKNAEHTSKTMRQRYQDPDFKKRWLESHWSRNEEIREEVIQKCIKGFRTASCHPNKFESRIHKIFDSAFPNEFTYTGNKRFGKSGTNPDFVHKSGKLVVLCDGISWHLDKKDLEDTQEIRKQVLFDEAKLFIKNNLSVLLIWDDGETWILCTGELQPIQHIISKFGFTNVF